MKTTIIILSCLSTVSVWAHGYNPGRLEDAIAKTDQAVIAKIIAIQETPIYHKLGDGTQGPLLTTQRDYTLEIIRVLAGSEHKPGVATYTLPAIERYDENGEVTMRMWIGISGSGIESRLEQEQEYVLCLRNNEKDQPSKIIRAEKVDRAEAVTTAMRQSQCWAVLKAAFTTDEYKSIRLVAYDSTNNTLAVMLPSPPRPEVKSYDSPRGRIYTATLNGIITRSHEFDINRHFNHLYFNGNTVVLRANNEYTIIFSQKEFVAWTPDIP